LDRVIVATDDQRIADAVDSTGHAEVVVTGEDFQSGTDRVAHVARDLGADVVVNVQGDEPLLDVAGLSAALRAFQDSDDELATLRAPLTVAADLWDPDTVKVVIDADGQALYFSRAPIPFPRAHVTVEPARDDELGGTLRLTGAPSFAGLYWIHVGVYLYRTPALLRWARMPPSRLEMAENLEQLRVFEAGERMQTHEVSEALPGVDTPADLERVRQMLSDSATGDNGP
jgi:3-deoxy-manno-octulosonate cytidylyltransferase (CMP-KDO synthetase)